MGPFEHLQMDFIELTPSKGYRYCLVIVDVFSRWVEAFPSKHADAKTVAKALIKEIIPRWGIPQNCRLIMVPIL
ncbi:NYNRI protein, partial [Polypterus senegalus]